MIERKCKECDRKTEFNEVTRLWSVNCKYATKAACEARCKTEWIWDGDGTGGTCSAQSPSIRGSSSSLASVPSQAVTLATPTFPSNLGVGFGFLPSGGISAKCACESGFAWQKDGDHPCGCAPAYDVRRREGRSRSVPWLLSGSGNGVGREVDFGSGGSTPSYGAVLRVGGLASAAPTGPCENKCGLDVTKKLEELFQAIRTYISTPGRKQAICGGTLGMTIMSGPYNYGNAWDICELAWQWQVFADGPCGRGACKKTATVNGKCYATDDINYWLWGVILGICEPPYPFLTNFNVNQVLQHPLQQALGQITPYRLMMGLSGERQGIYGRMCWLLHGWYRSSPSPYNPGSEFACKAAAEEFADCHPCDAEYTGRLHARVKGVTGEHVQIHNISTTGIVAWEPPIVGEVGRQNPNKLDCGSH